MSTHSKEENITNDTHTPSTQSDNNPDNEESAGDGTVASQQVLTGFKLLMCVIALCLCIFLNALDSTLVATILSLVGNEFNSFSKAPWLVSGYLLPGAVLTMQCGRVALVFGRKYTMLIGIAFFFIGSLICGLAKNMNMLIGGRVIAGVGGSFIQVLVFMVITEIVPIQKRGMMQGILSSMFGVASVVAPLIGGAFAKVTWRWNFYIALPLSAIAAAALFIFFNPPSPKGTMKEKAKQIDYIGTVLLGAGLVLLLLAMTFGATMEPWNSAIVIAFFVVGGVLLIVYFIYNFTLCKHPMFPIEVCKVPQVIAPALAMFFMYGGFLAAVVFLATYFQIVWQQDSLQSGIQLIPIILSVIVFSILMGVISQKTGHVKLIAIFGTICTAVGFAFLTLLDEHTSNSKKIGYLILPGIGVGSLFQSLNLAGQLAAPKANGGVLVATSMVAFGRTFGGVIGSTLGQTIESVVFASEVKGLKLPDGVDPTGLLNSPETILQLDTDTQQAVIKAFVNGFQKTMYCALAFQLAGFVCAIFFTNKKVPPKENKNGAHSEKA